MSSDCVTFEKPCCGCGICAVICPVKAIEIDLNKDGFFEAILEKNKCISCRQCLKVCQKFESNFSENIDFYSLPLYSAWSTDINVQMNSSSGGVCQEFLKYAFELSYKAAGVIYDPVSTKAIMITASNLTQADSFLFAVSGSELEIFI
jgi:coenzyme F420-reducing hydrogenase beta subunit